MEIGPQSAYTIRGDRTPPQLPPSPPRPRMMDHLVLQVSPIYLLKHPPTRARCLQRALRISLHSLGPIPAELPPRPHPLTLVKDLQHQQYNTYGNSHRAYTANWYHSLHRVFQPDRKFMTRRNAFRKTFRPSQSFNPSISKLSLGPFEYHYLSSLLNICRFPRFPEVTLT